MPRAPNNPNWVAVSPPIAGPESSSVTISPAAIATPLVTSAFRESRWDYVYEYAKQGKVREHRQFTAYFDDDKLARWEGDEMPQSVVELNRSAGAKGLSGVPKDDDRSFLERIKAIFSRD